MTTPTTSQNHPGTTTPLYPTHRHGQNNHKPLPRTRCVEDSAGYAPAPRSSPPSVNVRKTLLHYPDNPRPHACLAGPRYGHSFPPTPSAGLPGRRRCAVPPSQHRPTSLPSPRLPTDCPPFTRRRRPQCPTKAKQTLTAVGCCCRCSPAGDICRVVNDWRLFGHRHRRQTVQQGLRGCRTASSQVANQSAVAVLVVGPAATAAADAASVSRSNSCGSHFVLATTDASYVVSVREVLHAKVASLPPLLALLVLPRLEVFGRDPKVRWDGSINEDKVGGIKGRTEVVATTAVLRVRTTIRVSGTNRSE